MSDVGGDTPDAEIKMSFNATIEPPLKPTPVCRQDALPLKAAQVASQVAMQQDTLSEALPTVLMGIAGAFVVGALVGMLVLNSNTVYEE